MLFIILFLKGPMSTISDQKKRTLEALQQQYTAAKAKKLQDEQLKSHKNKVDVLKPKFDTPRKGKAPELTPRQKSAQPSSHKGLVLSLFFLCNHASFCLSPFPIILLLLFRCSIFRFQSPTKTFRVLR